MEDAILALRKSHVDLCIMRAEMIFHIWYEMSSVSFFVFNFYLCLVLGIVFIDLNISGEYFN